MGTDELLEQVFSIEDGLDDLMKRLEDRDKLAQGQEENVDVQLEAGLAALKNEERKETGEFGKASEARLSRQEKPLNDVRTMMKRVQELYEPKFGKVSRKIVPRKRNLEQLREFFQKVTDTTFLAMLKRLFGAAGYGKAKDMYEQFMYDAGCYEAYLANALGRQTSEDRYQLSLIKERYQNIQKERRENAARETEQIRKTCADDKSEWSAKSREELITGKLAEYDRGMTELVRQFPTGEECWEDYREPKPGNPRVYLGNIYVPFLSEDEMKKLFQMKLADAAPHAGHGDELLVPLLEPLTGGMKLFVELNERADWIAGLVQFLLLQTLHNMPQASYQFYYMDAIQNGRDLGDLTALNGLTDEETQEIHPALEAAGWRVLSLCQDRDDIRKGLQELADFMKRVSVLLGRTSSVEEFNRNHDRIIPYQLIVIQNFPSGMEDEDLDRLEGMLRQAKRFGFSFLIFGMEGISEDYPDLLDGFTGIRMDQEQLKISLDGYYLPLKLQTPPPRMLQANYLSLFRRVFQGSFSDLDNHFEQFIPYDQKAEVRSATDRMMIPFAVNRRGQLVELELASSLTAHGLLSGGTGSGKSTLLHAMIHSVMMHYRPEDVQLWLVDYKMAEFSIYAQNTPAHIRLIGLQNSQEFTFAFLDHVKAEYERRMELFKKATAEKGTPVTSLKTYRACYGEDSLPRILIIIDEFHNMTQHIQDNEYKEVLENQLSEMRACGMTYLFSDQTVSVGLRGLTEKGRRQIMVRLAMHQGGGDNPESEIVSTTGIEKARAKALNETMGVGEVLFQQQVPVMGADGRVTPKTQLLHCRTLYLDPNAPEQVQRLYIEKLLGLYGSPARLICVDGTEAKERNEEVIREYLSEAKKAGGMDEEDDGIPVTLGTPATLKPCMTFRVIRNYNQNIICVGDNNGMRMRILTHTVLSVLHAGVRVKILADENDALMRGSSRGRLEKLEEQGAELVTGYANICEQIDAAKRRILLRQRGREAGAEDVFLFWIGLDSMMSFFGMMESEKYEPPVSRRGAKPKKAAEKQKKDEPVSFDALMAKFDSLFGTASAEEPQEAGAGGLLDPLGGQTAGDPDSSDRSSAAGSSAADSLLDPLGGQAAGSSAAAYGQQADDEDAEDDFDEDLDGGDAFAGCYNACEDLKMLVTTGPMFGYFNYVTYSAVMPLLTYKRVVHVERFLHRIALKMDEISSGDLLNNKTKMASSELRPEQAVYYDGGRTGRYFIPYK